MTSPVRPLLMATVLASPLVGANLAPNPGMELGEDVPAAWILPTDPIEVARDTAVRHSGAAALRVATRHPGAQGSAALLVQLQPEQRYRISGWCRGVARGAGLGKASLALLCQDNQWKALQWTDLVPTSQIVGGDWRHITGTITVPVGTAQTMLMLFVSGDGTVWLDDVEVVPDDPEAVPIASTPATTPPDNLLSNGGMEAGSRQPVGWDIVTKPDQLEAARDEQVFHSGRASLRLSSRRSDADGNVSVSITVRSGQVLYLQAWVRGEATGELKTASLAFLAQGQEWKDLGWQDLVTTDAMLGKDWRRVTARFEVPAGTVRGRLLLYLKGQGNLWLDDVILSLDGPPPADALPITTAAVMALDSPPAAAEPGTRLLPDPGFERWSKGLPEGWRNLAPGMLRVVRDSKERQRGAAALRIEVQPPAVPDGTLVFDLPPVPGRALRITGWAKAKPKGRGMDRVSLSMSSLGADGVEVGWADVARSEDLSATRWRNFTGKATISERAVSTSLRLVASGSGTIWLDEVQVEVLP